MNNFLTTTNYFIDFLAIESIKQEIITTTTARVYWKGNIYEEVEISGIAYHFASINTYSFSWKPMLTIIHSEIEDDQLNQAISDNEITPYITGNISYRNDIYSSKSNKPITSIQIGYIDFNLSIESEKSVEAKRSELKQKAINSAEEIFAMKREYIVQLIKDGNDPLKLQE